MPKRRQAKQLTTTQRGYDYNHQQARRRALAALIDGTPCHLCGRPMYRAQARQLHLDHDPHGNGYRGLAHALCNTIDGAKRGGAATATRRGRGRYPVTGRAEQPISGWQSQQW